MVGLFIRTEVEWVQDTTMHSRYMQMDSIDERFRQEGKQSRICCSASHWQATDYTSAYLLFLHQN